MIEELSIRGLGVIEDVQLRFAPGLTVISGETGAGKTMLVTALGLLLGQRADSGLVRAGAAAASIDAVVVPAPAEAHEWMTDPQEPLIVARELPADGRSRARIAGRPAPVSALAEVLGASVEIHAQHEHVRLARPEVQRRLLDRSAGDPHERTLGTYRALYERWRELVDRAARLRGDARERARTLDRLRAEVAEIDAAALDPTTDDVLDQLIERLTHADDVRVGAATAAGALGSDGALDPIGIAVDALRRLPIDDPGVEELRHRAEGLAAEVAELAGDVRALAEGSEADPQALSTAQERKHLVVGLQRRFGVDAHAVLAYADAAREQIAALERDDADADALDADLAEAEAAARAVATDLRAARVHAGERLASSVMRHLADLGMPHARFEVEVAGRPDDALGPDGADEVRFLLAPNPGEGARPIASAVSGGERSRVSLAIEVALADVEDVAVLVFDEVDAGIGGATAMAVGEKLARLARGVEGRARQVLCVTHLAQLAAFADVHHVVEKGIADGRTVTTSRTVGADEREAELSRMLGGDPHAPAGLDHARELLASARERAS